MMADLSFRPVAAAPKTIVNKVAPMADPADLAQIQEDHFRDLSLSQRNRGLPPKGYCYNCDEPLIMLNGLYCDADCGSDHTARIRNERNVS